MDASKKKQNWLSENSESQLILLTDTPYPRLQLTYGGADDFRGTEEIDAEQFIAVKGYKAKGKRLTTYCLESVVELEPTRFPAPESPKFLDEPSGIAERGDDRGLRSAEGRLLPEGRKNEGDDEDLDPDAGKSEQQVLDELTGQLRLFDDEES